MYVPLLFISAFILSALDVIVPTFAIAFVLSIVPSFTIVASSLFVIFVAVTVPLFVIAPLFVTVVAVIVSLFVNFPVTSISFCVTSALFVTVPAISNFPLSPVIMFAFVPSYNIMVPSFAILSVVVIALADDVNIAPLFTVTLL